MLRLFLHVERHTDDEPPLSRARDLLPNAMESAGTITTHAGPVPLVSGSLAYYRGDEELRVTNAGEVGLTLLAFLAPPFPPRSPS